MVGIAVALMRYRRGSLSRQTTLSAALVQAMSGGLQPRGKPGNASGEGGVAAESEVARSSETSDDRSDPLVRDPWYQLVLCRECMLHGFYEAAEAGLRRLRGEGATGKGAGVGSSSEAVCVWTEVLRRVSAAEAFFAGSSDPVRFCERACVRVVTW